MEPNYVAYAIPVFVVLIGLEVWVSRRQGRQVYRFDDAVTALSCGIGSQVLNAFAKLTLIAGYVWIYEHLRVATLPTDAWWTWALAYVGVDFAYYWWHRWSHEVNWLWAAHIVHHQSEDYNLAVALRQAWFTSLTSWPFYAWMAIVGFAPVVIVTTVTFSTLYQFWIHTELVPILPRFGLLFNAPSHHRVHHAVNPRYLDKNYAATFIVWDRLFGTFEEESEAPVYGIVKPLRSFDTAWANVHHWVELARTAKAAPRWQDKLAIWWQAPPWRPQGMAPFPPPPEVSPQTRIKYGFDVPAALRWYVVAQLSLATLLATGLLLWPSDGGWTVPAVLGVLVLWTLQAFAGLLQGKPWALPVEATRLAAVALAAGLGLPALGVVPAVAWSVGLAVACASGAVLFKGYRLLRVVPVG